MRTRAWLVLVAVLLPVMPARSIAMEHGRDRLEVKTGPKDKSGSVITGNDAAAIAKLIDDINAAVKANKRRALSVITINTDVATGTLEQEKAQTGLSFGEIYVAHSLALSIGKKFDAIVKLHKSGKTWSQIARTYNVTLKGSRELLLDMQKP